MNVRFKTSTAQLLEASGVLTLAEWVLDRSQYVVFVFHRVLPREETGGFYNPHLAITPESFELFLQFVTRRGRVTSLENLVEAVRRGENVRRKLFALTFDDGWEDNSRIAWPILRRYGIPATIFLATGFVGTRRRLPEERLWHLWQRTKREGTLPTLQARLFADFSVAGDGQNGHWETYHRLLKTRPHRQALSLLEELEDRFGIDDLPCRSQFLTWEQVATLSREGVAFGSHSVNHCSLAFEAPETIRSELVESRHCLRKQLGREVEFFAYPRGIYDARVARLTSEAGYRGAVTTCNRAISAETNSYLLPRVAVDNTMVNDGEDNFSVARTRLHLLRACAS